MEEQMLMYTLKLINDMKTIPAKSVFLLILVMICCSCTSNNDKYIYPFYHYLLYIGFQDTSGNDLVKGIEFDWEDFYVEKPEKPEMGYLLEDEYTLEIIYPDLCMDVYYQRYRNSDALIPDDIGQHPNITVKKFDDRYYLLFDIVTCKQTMETKHCPMANMLTFKLSCPYIFGDDTEREIVTFWRKHTYRTSVPNYCYQIELDGKDYIPELIDITSGPEYDAIKAELPWDVKVQIGFVSVTLDHQK